jgi:hypothetical protein
MRRQVAGYGGDGGCTWPRNRPHAPHGGPNVSSLKLSIPSRVIVPGSKRFEGPMFTPW